MQNVNEQSIANQNIAAFVMGIYLAEMDNAYTIK